MSQSTSQTRPCEHGKGKRDKRRSFDAREFVTYQRREQIFLVAARCTRGESSCGNDDIDSRDLESVRVAISVCKQFLRKLFVNKRYSEVYWIIRTRRTRRKDRARRTRTRSMAKLVLLLFMTLQPTTSRWRWCWKNIVVRDLDTSSSKIRIHATCNTRSWKKRRRRRERGISMHLFAI